MTVTIGRRGILPLAATCAIALIAFGGNYAQGDEKTTAERGKSVTYSKDVAPIFQANCVTCHSPGEIGPMPLRTFTEVRPWVNSIRDYVSEGTMPPWHADPGYGPFSNDRSLTAEEIDTIVRWAALGAPEGDRRDLPVVDEAGGSGWKLGEPDYVIEFEEVNVPGGGPDRFHDLVAQTNFPEDRWVSAVEIRPGDPRVVHHVILWQGGPSPQGWIGAWAAGNMPTRFPEGTGRLLKKGARIIGDFHYHPIAEATTDVTRVGLHFAKGEIEKELINLWIMNDSFEIPAGAPNYEAKSSFTFTQDSQLLSLTPHMHYRGKDFRFTATYPDGRIEELLKVSNYDFNWQTTYFLEESIAMPKGTRIDCVAHWDNSDQNPANPDPSKVVRFGNQSYDEMMIGFADFIVDEGIRPGPMKSPIIAKLAELSAQHPGEVFEMRIQALPGQPVQLSALHLPQQGEGGWYIEMGDIAAKARVTEISWDGQSFEGKLLVPGQAETKMKGQVDVDAGVVTLVMIDSNGNEEPLTGTMVKP